jgi:hypothetical protein
MAYWSQTWRPPINDLAKQESDCFVGGQGHKLEDQMALGGDNFVVLMETASVKQGGHEGQQVTGGPVPSY